MMIFNPQNKEIMRDIRFATQNKMDTLDCYLSEIREGKFKLYDCVIQKIIIMDLDEWDDFINDLMVDRYDLFSRYDGGFTDYTDGKKYRNVTMVIARGKCKDNTIYIDNSGYLYARYVGL